MPSCTSDCTSNVTGTPLNTSDQLQDLHILHGSTCICIYMYRGDIIRIIITNFSNIVHYSKQSMIIEALWKCSFMCMFEIRMMLINIC